jgi:hypothetical protein
MPVYDDYMARYGGVLSRVSNPQRVHGALLAQGPAPRTPAMPAFANNMPTDAANVGALQQPGAAPLPPEIDLLERPPVQAPQQPAADVPQVSFEDVWAGMPEDQKTGAIRELEQQVGDVDDAYAQLMEAMGERPDEKLSRQDKGMLIMEFGLHLMSQSAAGRHGEDIGGAIGDAGINALQSFQMLKARKRAEGEAYDRTLAAITKERGEAMKSARAEARETATTEANIRKINAEIEKMNREATERKEPTPHWITYNDDASGYSYAVNAEDPTNRIQLGKLTEKDKAGEQRPYEFERKFDYYMRTYGVDDQGAPLAEDSDRWRTVARDALQFANRTEGMDRGEAFQFAREQATKDYENGLLGALIDANDGDYAKAVDARTEELMKSLGFPQAQPSAEQPFAPLPPGPRARGPINREVDVTSDFPPQLIDSIPEGQQVINDEGQIFLRRGNRILYVGTQPRQ